MLIYAYLDHIYAYLSMLKFLEWESLFEFFRLKVPLVGLMILGTSEKVLLAIRATLFFTGIGTMHPIVVGNCKHRPSQTMH